jgi:hypothetical protein
MELKLTIFVKWSKIAMTANISTVNHLLFISHRIFSQTVTISLPLFSSMLIAHIYIKTLAIIANNVKTQTDIHSYVISENLLGSDS